MNKSSCVIGLGSPFGADQFGWLVIERLRQNHALQSFSDSHIELICADRPGINLLHLMRGKAQVILIDAIDNRAEPGKILRLDRQQLLQQDIVLSSHAIGAAEALALGEKLGELPDKLVLFGACVDVEDSNIDMALIVEMEKLVIKESAQLSE